MISSLVTTVKKKNGQATQNMNVGQYKNSGKFIWFDLRELFKQESIYPTIIKALSTFESCGVVIDEIQFDDIPAAIRKVLFVKGIPDKIEQLCEKFDTLILEEQVIHSDWFARNKAQITKPVGAIVHVHDPATLQKAVEMTHILQLVIVEFKDETKIPLEIVLADAQNFNCQVIMKVQDNLEAKVVFGVLECGADGVIVKVDDLHQLYSAYEEVKLASQQLTQELKELVILETNYAGMGDRACIDMISHLGLDEGILIGSFSNGGILACSETHPLPYMKTRPFRVNAGSLQSYVLAPDNQTWYLSDLTAGMELLVINTKGEARGVTVGRVKIERRPILEIIAQAPDNTIIKVFMQADWHVRVFGVDGKPINITTLKSGDKVLGYTMEPGRHVGVKVKELIIEQ